MSNHALLLAVLSVGLAVGGPAPNPPATSLAEYIDAAAMRVALARRDHDGTTAQDRRIIGGNPELFAYPWVVRITTVQAATAKENLITSCTGSLVNRRWILTAAHCLLNKEKEGMVNEGEIQAHINCADPSSPDCQVILVTQSVPHPCYQPQGRDDLHMLKLERDAVLPDGAPYALLDNFNGAVEWSAGDVVTLAGFGVTSANTKGASDTLQALQVPIASQAECSQANPSYPQIDFSGMFCTGGSEGKDSCMGDSGGPAIVKSQGKDFLIGVLSFGSQLPNDNQDCAVEGRYGVYTEVSSYAEFIYDTMTDNVHQCDTCPCERTRKGFDEAVRESLQFNEQNSRQGDSNVLNAAPKAAAGSLWWTLLGASSVLWLSARGF